MKQITQDEYVEGVESIYVEQPEYKTGGDGDDNECDPFKVPDGFWPVTIAIHLGKRIG